MRVLMSNTGTWEILEVAVTAVQKKDNPLHYALRKSDETLVVMKQVNKAGQELAMDMTGNIPGAINAEDLQTALDHLEESIEKEAATEKPPEFGDEVFDDERKAIERQIVSAKARAFPLIELLKISIKKQKSVMWDYE
ncbi:hypothetical protein GQR58_025290 [Nymphon striatum]|nr:hypothetical protein GQR58_025290 [Nymphon striatum]